MNIVSYSKRIYDKLKIFLLTISLILFCSGCNTLNDKLLDDRANEVISNYIIDMNINRFARSDKQFEVHKIYGIEKKSNVINVYMYSLYEGFSFIDDSTIKLSSGASIPVFISLKQDNDNYIVIGYAEPKDGEQYEKSVRDMFPTQYVGMALNDADDKELLKKGLEQKVHEWSVQEGRTRVIE